MFVGSVILAPTFFAAGMGCHDQAMSEEKNAEHEEPLSVSEEAYEAFKNYDVIRNKENRGEASRDEIQNGWDRLKKAIHAVQAAGRS